MRARLVIASVAAAVAVSVAAPAYGATTATTRPHPKAPPPKVHHKVNTALPPGTRILEITTVPQVGGVVFTFQGAHFSSDDSGSANLEITPHERDLLAADRNGQLDVATATVTVQPGVRAVFTGWSGAGSYANGIDKQIATFQLEYLTGFRFVNRTNTQVTPTLLQSMQLMSSIGETLDLRNTSPQWLLGSQIVTGSHGLESRDIFYKITRAVVAGSNVVNSAQQRFYPSETQTVTVRLLFYTVRFVATDAMFGGGVGKGVDLQYPDGKVRHIAFGARHAVTVDDLPRGDYHVTVVGGGMRMARPVSISRDQRADLDVISYVDVGVVGVALGAIALVVLWFGLQLRRRNRGYDPRAARRAKRARKAAERVAAKAAKEAAAVTVPEGDARVVVPAAGAVETRAPEAPTPDTQEERASDGDTPEPGAAQAAPEPADVPADVEDETVATEVASDTADVEPDTAEVAADTPQVADVEDETGATEVEPDSAGVAAGAGVEPGTGGVDEIEESDAERVENQRFLVDSRTQEPR